MNKIELMRATSARLREEGIRKPVSSPKKVFHISDDEGNSKDFIMQLTEKWVGYSTKDVENILDALISVILDALKQGDSIAVRSFGVLGLRYHKARIVKSPHDGQLLSIGGDFYPRFLPAKDTKIAARAYGQMLRAQGIDIDSQNGDGEDAV